MKKNIYYQDMFQRPKILKMLFLNFFYVISMHFRIPIETLVRKNFGERYFNQFTSIIVGIVLLAIPQLLEKYSSEDTSVFLSHFGTWYIYTAVYFFCLFRRWQEVKREPSVFDFERFSLSTGSIHPFFTRRCLKNGEPNLRRIEIFYEPGVFFIAGAILAYFSQPIGYLLMLCAIIYSFGYMAAYAIGDDFVMDKIDEMIINEELSGVFVDGKESSKGFKFYGRRPDDRKLREDLYDAFIEDDGTDDEEPTIVN